MSFFFIENLPELIRMGEIFGFPMLALIDSILVCMAIRRKADGNVSLFANWIEFHHRHGVMKINFIKIMIAVFIPYPIMITGARVGLLFLCFIHEMVFFYRLFFKPHS